jgi:hypothetical protein
MMMRPGVPDVHITDSQDSEMAEYRPLAGQAVIALIFALLSPLALCDVSLWFIPGLGIFFSWWALRRIKIFSPAITGHKMALAGLLLSLLFLAIAPSNWLAYRLMVRNEARQFAAIWLRYVNQNEPQKAFQLMLAPSSRVPIDDNLSEAYRSDPHLLESFEKFTTRKDVQTLLALGPKAQIRYYDVASQVSEGFKDFVNLLYAVTYEENNEKKSFFLVIETTRTKPPGGNAFWRISQLGAPARPEGW